MAVLRAFFAFCVLSVFAFGFFMTKRAHENMDQIQTMAAGFDCIDQATRIANERDRAAALDACLGKAGALDPSRRRYRFTLLRFTLPLYPAVG